MILLIDNFDSFVYNLARYFEELGEEPHIVRTDAVGVDAIRALEPEAIVISPGPCDPSRAGVSVPAVRELGPTVPILGVCLGHQAIGEACGARIVRALPVHGRAARVHHRGDGLFAGLPSPIAAARYHSLVVEADSLPSTLEVSAWTDDGTIMGLRHRVWPVHGVQFHPESILTEHGHAILAGFLRLARHDTCDRSPTVCRSA